MFKKIPISFIFFLFIFKTSWAQNITLKGWIFDQMQKPLSDLLIKDSISQKYTYSDINGYFELSVDKPSHWLIIEGYSIVRKIVKTIDTPIMKILVQSKQINPLDEVHVIAYGTTTQRFNLGSITKVTAEDIATQPISNPLLALQGRVPGLIVNASSGLPGASVQIQIRGQNSLNSNPLTNSLNPRDNPFFVIDGVPYAPQNANINQVSSISSPGNNALMNNNYGGLSPFNVISPNDIESIEVLRDADATAIYGARGANGVILITTKKGRKGKTAFNANVYKGISQTGKLMPMMNTADYLKMRKEAFTNDGRIPDANASSSNYAPDLTVYDSTYYNDWQQFFIGGNSDIIETTIDVNGGNEQTQFTIGGNYLKQGYIYPGPFSDNKGGVHFTLNHQAIDNKLTIAFTGSYGYEKNNLASAPNLLSAFRLEPNFPQEANANTNPTWNYNNVPLGNNNAAFNPIAYLKSPYYMRTHNLMSNLRLVYKNGNFSGSVNLGYNRFNTYEYSGSPTVAQNPANTTYPSAKFGENNFNNWSIEPQLNYHVSSNYTNIDFMVGATLQDQDNTSTLTTGNGYISDQTIGSINGASNVQASSSSSNYKYTGIFSRVNVLSNHKWIGSINFRRDGSSRFGTGRRGGNFGSIGGGWIFTEENWTKKWQPLLSYGKVRLTYGLTGSDNIADYQYQSFWTTTGSNYDGSKGYYILNPFNKDFSWAKTGKLEAGISLGFLSSRLLLDITYYSNRSGNQLVMLPLPYQTGYSSVVDNWNAKVENRGLELSANAKIFDTKNWKWSVNINFSLPKNVLLAFPNRENTVYATTYKVGKSVNSLFKWKLKGVNDTTGLFQFYDKNNQLTYSPVAESEGDWGHKTYIGTIDPKYYGGISNTISYKGLQCSILFDFRKQMGRNYLGQVYVYTPGLQYNLPASFNDRWQKIGDHSDIERLTMRTGSDANSAGRNFLSSDGVYSDASYLKLRNISITYNLPITWLGWTKSTNCSIYLTGQNLFTISNYKGIDPETQNFYGVPSLKTFTAGIKLSL